AVVLTVGMPLPFWPAVALNGPILHPAATVPMLVPGKLVVPLVSTSPEHVTADACPPPPASRATNAIAARPKIRAFIRSAPPADRHASTIPTERSRVKVQFYHFYAMDISTIMSQAAQKAGISIACGRTEQSQKIKAVPGNKDSIAHRLR